MKFKTWLQTEGFKEVEFVCTNPDFPHATSPQARDLLWNMLKQIPGLIIYQQDWEDYSAGQQSMCAIVKAPSPPNTMQLVKKAAQQAGVKIDLVVDVSPDRLDNLDNITKSYDTDAKK